MTPSNNMGRSAVALVIAAIMSTPASATQVSHTFCFKYDLTGFTDRTTGDELTATTFVAKGTKFTIIRNVSPFDSFSYTVGTDGCKVLTLEDDDWKVRVNRTADVNGSTVEVRGSGGGIYYSQVESAFTPTNNTTTTWTSSGDVARIMAAATYALSAHNGGLSNETYSFRDTATNCPNNGAGCYDSSTDTVNIGSLVDYKFGIAHEMGHAMSRYANVGGMFHFDCDKTNVDCPNQGSGSHSMASKEWQSCAAVEGVANGYAALAFNDENQSDCEFEKQYAVDWNGDGDGGADPGEDTIFSCEGGTTATTPAVPDQDYLGAFCLGSGVANNRGTEYDWLRAVWDLYSDDGVNFGTFLSIWDGAEPHTWSETGNGTGSDYPAARMSTSAGNISGALGTKWDNNAADNGIDR